ncbi:MliC family protein [Pseudomonas sp. Z5-35]|uniref:MliC family protein n=1 Tax=unclassified Pseudomonas TaxID=196821 RepID=UPI003DA886A1
MKGFIAVVALALLAGCSQLGFFQSSEPAVEGWTSWTCDSEAKVLWRYADAAHKEVDVRLGGAEKVYHLKLEPGAEGSLYSDDMLAFHVKGEEGLAYWVATNDLIGRGCKAQ